MNKFDAEELLIFIRIQIDKKRGCGWVEPEGIGIVISENNLNILISHIKKTSNIIIPEKVSEITVFGCRILPSEFILDNEIIVSEIKKINL
jgi:hypothetical protein